MKTPFWSVTPSKGKKKKEKKKYIISADIHTDQNSTVVKGIIQQFDSLTLRCKATWLQRDPLEREF